jgi:hypothetical protein
MKKILSTFILLFILTGIALSQDNKAAMNIIVNKPIADSSVMASKYYIDTTRERLDDRMNTLVLGGTDSIFLASIGYAKKWYIDSADVAAIDSIEAHNIRIRALEISGGGGGSADSATFSTNYRVDTTRIGIESRKLANSDTAIMLTHYLDGSFSNKVYDSLYAHDIRLEDVEWATWEMVDTTRGKYIRTWNGDSVNIRGRVDIQRQDTTLSTFAVRLMNTLLLSLDSNTQRKTIDSIRQRFVQLCKQEGVWNMSLDSLTQRSAFHILSMPDIAVSQDTTKGTFIRQWIQDTAKVNVFSDTTRSALGVKILNVPGTRMFDGYGTQLLSTSNNLHVNIAAISSAAPVMGTSRPSSGSYGLAVRLTATGSDSATSNIPVNITSMPTAIKDSIAVTNRLLRKYLQYVGESNDSLWRGKITAINDGSDSLESNQNKGRLILHSDSTNTLYVTSIFVANGDSTQGFELFAYNQVTGGLRSLLLVPRLIGNPVGGFNLVGTNIRLVPHEFLYGRKLLRNGANYYNYQGLDDLYLTIMYRTL